MSIIRLTIIVSIFLIWASNCNLAQTNWTSVRGNENDSDGLLQQIFFVNGSLGWIVDYKGRIIRTNDGGKGWNVTFDNAAKRLNSIFFVDNAVGYVAGHAPGTNAGRNFGDTCLVMRTIDGGTNWSDLSPANEFRTCSLRGLYFQNREKGFAVGEVQHPYEPNPSAVIFSTDDGGRTWNATFPRFKKLQALYAIQFSDSVGLAVGRGAIIKKSVKAQRWEEAYSQTNIDFFDLDIQGNRIWAVGSNGTIVMSTDNGVTWTRAKLSNEFSKFWFSDVVFLDEKQGWVVGGFADEVVVLTTRDSGRTWLREKTGDTTGFLKSVARANGRLIAVGEEGLLVQRVLDRR